MRAPGVYANHPALFELVDRQAAVEKIAGGFGFTEGPVFSRRGYLLFSDIPNERIYQWTPGARGGSESSNPVVLRERSNRANGLTFDHQGRLLACEMGTGRVTRTEKDGTITVLAAEHEGKRLTSPNDLVYAIDGSIYFTDLPGRDASPAADRTNRPAVYRIERSQIPGRGRLEVVSEECQRPNGVALDPKQQLLYVADSARKEVRVHAIHDDGTLARGSVFAELTSDESGAPDGLKTDERGNVYATGPGGVWVFDAKGKHLGTIVLPEQPSNLSWGNGFTGLYVTARTSVYYVATKVSGTRTF
jgi:gluconolactonase